jgi:hypothetical protein
VTKERQDFSSKQSPFLRQRPFAVVGRPLLMRGLLFGLLVETRFSVNRTLVSYVVAKRFCKGLIVGKLCQVWRCNLDHEAREEAKLGSEFVVNLKSDPLRWRRQRSRSRCMSRSRAIYSTPGLIIPLEISSIRLTIDVGLDSRCNMISPRRKTRRQDQGSKNRLI